MVRYRLVFECFISLFHFFGERWRCCFIDGNIFFRRGLHRNAFPNATSRSDQRDGGEAKQICFLHDKVLW